MPPVRTIEFKVTHAGLVPGSPQFAGVQGEHNATRVSFLLDTVLQTGYVYRIEYVDGRGNWDTTDLLTISDGAIAYDLPSAWTRNGGEAEIHLVASALDSEGKETQTYFSLAGKLYYEDKSADETGETKAGLTELIQDTHEAIDEANQATDNANEAAERANNATGALNQALSDVEEAIDDANEARDAANEAADAAYAAIEQMGDKVDAVDALPVYTMERQSGPDSWKPTPGIAVPDTGPYTGMAIRAVWEEEWDASVPIWCFGSIVPIKPSGTYPSGAYILLYDGEVWQLQADMASVTPKADADDALTVIPTVTLLCDIAGDLSYDLRRDGAAFWLNGTPGEAIRVVSDTEWQASGTAPKYGINIKGKAKPIKPAGTYPAGAYILMYDGESFQVQADMSSVLEKANKYDPSQVIPYTETNYDGAIQGYWVDSGIQAVNGTTIRAYFSEEWTASGNTQSGSLIVGSQVYAITPAGTYPAGTYLLTYRNLVWTIQSLDMAYTDERAKRAADEAAEAHAAQVRRTYQPAWKRTAGGCPLSVADAAEGADLSSLVLKGRTMVSGTPSPDAPVTITGVKPQTVAVTGKNLIPPKAASETINGVTCTVNADGSLTLNGTATATTFFNFPYTKIIPGIYTLSAGVRLAANVNLILRKRTPEKQLIYVYSGSDSNAKTKLIGYSGEVRVYVEVRSGTTVSNLTIYPQLEAGSEATAYEPYQGETITSDEVELYGDAHTVGKNLIPTMDEPLSANGITCTVNVDGSITLNGTATANAYFYFPDIMIMSSGTYTLSTSANLAGGTSYVLRTRSNNVWLINIQAGSKSKSEAISYSGAAQAYIAVASGTTLSNLTIYPQLELGSKATAYEPYQGMTTALEDGDSLDLATGEVVRRWKRLELDGTEKWTIQSVNEYGITNFNTVLSDGGDFAKGCICTHYVTQYTVIANTHDRGIFISNTHSLFIRETAYTTVEEFKTWLAAQKAAGAPVTIVYRLRIPQTATGTALSIPQPEGEMVISALGNRGETVEAVDTEALYTYRPDWDDVLNRLAALENLISEGDVTSAELAAHNTNESAHANLVIDGNIK